MSSRTRMEFADAFRLVRSAARRQPVRYRDAPVELVTKEQ